MLELEMNVYYDNVNDYIMEANPSEFIMFGELTLE